MKKLALFTISFFFITNSFLFSQNKNSTTKKNIPVKCKTEIIFNTTYPFKASISAEEKIQFLQKQGKKNSGLKISNSSQKYSELNFKTNLSSSTISQKIGLKLNYLKFANFFFDFVIASGWNYNKFRHYGLAENQNIDDKIETKPYNFSKALLKFEIATELFFNLNFFVKNDWSNLQFSSIQLCSYKILLPKKENEFWYFQNDEGTNRTGFIYSAIYSVEYNMPLYLNKIRMDFTTLKRLYKPLPKTFNRSEKLWDFGLHLTLFFKPTDLVTIRLSSSFGTEPNYYFHNRKTHFINKIVNSKKPQNFYFKKISAGVILSVKK